MARSLLVLFVTGFFVFTVIWTFLTPTNVQPQPCTPHATVTFHRPWFPYSHVGPSLDTETDYDVCVVIVDDGN